MKRRLWALLLAAAMCITLVPTVAHAEEIEEVQEDTSETIQSQGEIVGFEKLSESEKTYIINIADKPDLESLTAAFPATLTVYLENQSETEEIDVTWYSVGEDYTAEDAYYFQFSPQWNMEAYPLSENFEVIKDAPYISVFFTEESSVSDTAVTNIENETIIYDFLKNEMGFNTAAACGVLANLYHESTFNPNALGDKGTSYGICQWHNERWTAMQKWCDEKEYDWTTLEGQLYYLKFELSQNNSAYLWNGKTIYNYISSVENTAEGAYNAGYYWCYYFEVPANKEAVSVTRGNLAKNTYWESYRGEEDSGSNGSDSGNNGTEIPKDNAPVGYFDEAHGGINEITVKGWVYDPDDVDAALTVDIYVDGAYAATCIANQPREDVDAVYDCGANHGFELTFDYEVESTGTHVVSAYAINKDSTGKNTLLEQSPITVTVTTDDIIGSTPDTSAPVISNINIAVDETGYTITCNVTDESTLEKVVFPTWSAANGQDDLDSSWETSTESEGKIDGDTVTFRVNLSDHNNETGLYFTHLYAYDELGNAGQVSLAIYVAENGEYGFEPVTMYATEDKLYALFDAAGCTDHLMRWAEAAAYCQSIGGKLASITSQEENEIIASMVSEYGDLCWIGANDIANEGTFVWESGEDFNYTNWAGGEPGNLDSSGEYEQDYLVMATDGKWDDYHYMTTNAFVCEFDVVHNWEKVIITKEATCTEAGEQTKICSECMQSITEEIAAHGHKWEEEYTIDKEPTYTEEGSKSIHCSICDERDVSTVETIPVLEPEPDTTAPVISNIDVVVDDTGYIVTCKVTDDSVLKKVLCPTWTAVNGQDDLDSSWETSAESAGTMDKDIMTFRVNISDHNDETGLYFTHIYAYDEEGNRGQVSLVIYVAEDGEYGFDPVLTYETEQKLYVLFDAAGNTGNLMRWAEAAAYCQSIGGYLASITSQEENEIVASLVSKYGASCWIGANDVAEEGTFVWESGEDFGYTNWADGEPGNIDSTGEYEQEYLTMLTSGEWDDLQYMTTRAFVCEFDKFIFEMGFTDVAKSDWFYDAVEYACMNGITNGMTETTFVPGGVCTRAQVVTFLWRACGKPEPTTTTNPFEDVEKGTFYYNAVLWAVENGITTGTSETTFSPNESCTRGHVVTFLWRAKGEPAFEMNDTSFIDIESGRFYEKAVYWAVENGITNGTNAEGTIFGPKDACTRAQIVTFLFRAFA